MTRQGLNCTLSYVDASNTTHTYQVRAGDIGFGTKMISDESAARIHRAYYPHKSANEQFSVQILLKTWTERAHFMNWLATYAQWALDPNVVTATFPYMTVNIPLRNYYQRGLPIQGYDWGAHTGMMMFSPSILFEAAFSPGQGGAQPTVSSVINKWSAFASDTAIQYFYPFGTQLSGSQVPISDYSNVVPPSGTAPSASGSGSGTTASSGSTTSQISPTPTGAAPTPPIGEL